MPTYTVTLPVGGQPDRTLLGWPVFRAGEPQTHELSALEADHLRRKGFVVELLPAAPVAPAPEPPVTTKPKGVKHARTTATEIAEEVSLD